jgi:hypothetical protein
VTVRELRLGRRPGWATALAAATAAIGVILAVRGLRGSPPLLIIGGALIVAGLLAYFRALRPWFLDEQGLSLAGHRRLLWSEVTRIQVVETTPKGANGGAPRIDLTVGTSTRKATLQLTSRKDADRVAALLKQHLPAHIEGREDLQLVDAAWKHVT